IWAGALLAAGADVAGLDLREDVPASLDDGARPSGGGRFLALRADVTSGESLRAALGTVRDALGPPSILVNNAGIDRPPSSDGGSWEFAGVPDELSAAVIDVNALGVLRACQVYGAEMVKHGGGSIINIGSLYGTVAPDPRLYAHIPL